MATPDDLGSSLLGRRADSWRRIWWYAASAGALIGALIGNGSDIAPVTPSSPYLKRAGLFWFLAALGIFLVVVVVGPGGRDRAQKMGRERRGITGSPEEVESEVGVVAADDWRCSEVGAAALRAGGHAVDAAVAAALCLGVVHPVSSGIGGGAFMVVRSADSGEAVAIDSRETAPIAASKGQY
ncbi:Gamma-glutamyltranspeptidase [Musa troglodytarum]|uniref:Gamma-glutamyltranspeptidase n=1 Tax=Musa troglodytarum TaxID=320322 RepID=A0A9E7GFK4_9LILI|nr:Gamma-glutamyltranspeptidase [Musa troglodytarum]